MNGDFTVGLLAVLIGVIYSAQSLRLPKAMIGNPWAPVYFPLTLGVLMTVLGAALCLKNIGKRRPVASKGPKEAKEPEKKPQVDKEFPKLALGTIALCILYAVAFNKLGFIVSTILFLGAMLFLVNGLKGWRANIAVAVLFTYGIWFTFDRLLMISLP
ncbi:MAG: tripartite tricarboxylate transporter TctB family protein [Clostridia bacterium]|nr:tripartite tricarboxylate transporter TctB family protein [Clostridia bacterium]